MHRDLLHVLEIGSGVYGRIRCGEGRGVRWPRARRARGVQVAEGLGVARHHGRRCGGPRGREPRQPPGVVAERGCCLGHPRRLRRLFGERHAHGGQRHCHRHDRRDVRRRRGRLSRGFRRSIHGHGHQWIQRLGVGQGPDPGRVRRALPRRARVPELRGWRPRGGAGRVLAEHRHPRKRGLCVHDLEVVRLLRVAGDLDDCVDGSVVRHRSIWRRLRVFFPDLSGCQKPCVRCTPRL
mmetsp:Transcript_80587/g.226741  ORF Transcript_80587/g.226741 Transcript_80587/m.226741 type:complete len:237 (+) Transcript_80587:171-881(+)